MAGKQDLEKFLRENPMINYYPEALKSGLYSTEEMRKHYSYYRAIANKRLQHFQGSEYEKHQSFLRNKDKFVPLSQIGDERELIYKLYEVRKFLGAKTSSVSGIRASYRQTVETMHERGWTFINMSNLAEFGDFMEECRLRGYRNQYGSERCGDLFREAKKKGMTPNELFTEFHLWAKNLETLQEMPKHRNANMRTSAYYADALKKIKEKR